MKWRTKIVLILLSVVAMAAGAQSSRQDGGKGVWIDSSTGFMWAARDNGKDVSWKGAVKYCRNLHLAGYADWRLANLFELQPIYDKTANAPGLAGMHDDIPTMWHVKGNLFLTGYQWANHTTNGGRSSGYENYFDFNEGKSNDDPTGWPYPYSFRRALCVRGSGNEVPFH